MSLIEELITVSHDITFIRPARIWCLPAWACIHTVEGVDEWNSYIIGSRESSPRKEDIL